MIALAAVIGVAFILLYSRPYPLLLASVALLFAVLALANNLTSGLLGYVDLSAAGVFAVGAYTGGLLGTQFGLPIPLSLAAGLVAGMFAGGLISLSALRLRGNEIAMATLAVTIVVNGLLINADQLTGGPDGFGGIIAWDHILPFLGGGRRADFLVSAVTLLAVGWLFRNLRRTRYWRGWIAMGDDIPAAMSCGISPSAAVRSAFILAGAVTGLAGAEYAHIQRHIAPGNFGLMDSVIVVCAVMLGGRGNLAGPSVAAAILWIIPEQLHFAYYARMLLFGVLLLVMLRSRPEGLFPMRPMRYPVATFPPQAKDEKTDASTVMLQVDNLSKCFDGFLAVEDVTFKGISGECLVITGSNGSGKTLTLDMITGYLVPSYGNAVINGQPIQGRTPDSIARLGIRRTFQESRLFSRLSVLEHALVGGHCIGKASLLSCILWLPVCRDEEQAILAKARSVLALFGRGCFLPRENDLATSFSFGNRRRIEIARCLAANILIVLMLDEPFIGFPPDDAKQLTRMLREQLVHGCMLVVEHDADMVAKIADREIKMEAGHVVFYRARQDSDEQFPSAEKRRVI
jgi:branched-chain amino acid transport system ATP-binding protein/branched-chain amino acid transport system permease protein